ncbi:MAG: cell division protein MraZ [bacterium ADurb.Bin212]|nr:MAG: cell division protein MraZ [bacterium ADurb.Bin212]
MFIGEHSHTLDDKNRLSIPVKFRASLASGCVVTRGLDHCLWIYPAQSFNQLAEKISELPITQKNARSFSRLMLAGATELEIDKSGRVVLPKYLIEYAGIGSKVSVNGVYDRIEIWPEQKWKEFKKEMEDNSEEVAENLDQLGF